MRKFFTYSASCLALFAFAQSVSAQNFEFLSDYLRYDDQRQWVSLSGAIELKTDYGYFYPNAIEYDIANEQLYIDGEMRGVLPTGERVIAQYSELDFQTQAAVLRSVRVLLLSGMQSTATRFEDNDNAIYAENIVASTCVVCVANPTPIWQVRAEQLYMDKAAQKVYVRNGYFDFFGVPVAWLPYLRLPAPDAIRMEGFLPLTFKATTTDASGMTIGYYYPLSNTADATATAQFSTGDFQILSGQLRQNGQGYSYQLEGNYINSSNSEDDGRNQIIQKLAFRLPGGWNGQSRYSLGSDYDVARDFELEGRSSNYAYIEKYTNNYWSHNEVIKYLPPSEAAKDNEYPLVFPHAQYEYSRVLESDLQFNSDLDFLYLDQVIGEDVLRLSSDINFKSVDILPFGILASTEFGLQGGAYNVENASDTAQNGNAMRLTPYASTDVQMPFISSTDLADYILTPRMMLAWSENYDSGVEIPNTDSLFVEHDFVSLFANNHFTGRDQFESGFRGSLGVSYTMITPQNQNFEFGLGRIWSSAELLSNSGTSYAILDDWVGYLNYSLNDEWSFYSRFAFDNRFDFTRSEIEFNYDSELSDYTIGWVRLAPEPEIGFNDIRSEVLLDGRYQFAPNWQVNYDLRYDLADTEPFDAGLSLTYGNECIEVKLGTSWNFSAATPSGVEQSYNLNVEFFGLSEDRKEKWAKRTCSHQILN